VQHSSKMAVKVVTAEQERRPSAGKSLCGADAPWTTASARSKPRKNTKQSRSDTGAISVSLSSKWRHNANGAREPDPLDSVLPIRGNWRRGGKRLAKATEPRTDLCFTPAWSVFRCKGWLYLLPLWCLETMLASCYLLLSVFPCHSRSAYTGGILPQN
jgi:hypothetical protein